MPDGEVCTNCGERTEPQEASPTGSAHVNGSYWCHPDYTPGNAHTMAEPPRSPEMTPTPLGPRRPRAADGTQRHTALIPDMIDTRTESSTTNATVTIRIENTYTDSHKSERTTEVDPPASLSATDLDAWWTDVVVAETGDGHGIDSELGFCYTVTVLEAPTLPALVGQTNEWVG